MEAKTSKDSYSYWKRRKFNAIPENSVERSALFMVLNRHYKKTLTIVSKEELDRISDLIIQGEEYIHTDFQESINAVQPGDFVYFDPPYVPFHPHTFVGYVKMDFARKDTRYCLMNTTTGWVNEICHQ